MLLHFTQMSLAGLVSPHEFSSRAERIVQRRSDEHRHRTNRHWRTVSTDIVENARKRHEFRGRGISSEFFETGQTVNDPTLEIAIAALPAPRPEDEPLTPVLAAERAQLAEVRKLLADKIGAIDAEHGAFDATSIQLTSLMKTRDELTRRAVGENRPSN